MEASQNEYMDVYGTNSSRGGGSGASGEQSPVESNGGSPVPGNGKFKRNYRACLNCRVRKVKCDLGPVDNPRDGKCARCQRERKDCVFVESKRGGAANVSLGKKKRKIDSVGGGEISPQSPVQEPQPYQQIGGTSEKPPGEAHDAQQDSAVRLHLKFASGIDPDSRDSTGSHRLPSVTNILNESSSRRHSKESFGVAERQDGSHQTPNNHFSTMEGALVFLAKAAGTIAKADERDHIDARTKHQQIEAQMSHKGKHDWQKYETKSAGESTAPPARPAVGAAPVTAENGPTRDMAGSKHSIPAYMKPNYQKRMSMPAAENGFAVRPKASTKLSNIEYIGEPNGILSEAEAERLINLFFSTMHPFFPHIPKFLHSPDILSGYPILLCTIITIASRYHPLENNVGVNGAVPRNIEIHDRLWLYVQRLISQTVWAEASTRSIGTIFAFYLFTEWNPRAIHWRWSDYANKAEEDSFYGAKTNASAAESGGEGANLAGLGAMRRSYRMAWMLIGSAVRLAQDMGFMEISSKTFLASHIAEINSVMNISRRSMLAHSLSEVDLDEDEISEEDMENVEEDDDGKFLRMTEDDLKRISSEHTLRFTKSQKAQIELLQIMSLGHESLYGFKAQLGGLSQRQNLSVLNIISPLINNWGRKYRSLLTPSPTAATRYPRNDWLNPNSKASKEVAEIIEQESLVFEFNYVKLYIYSLALSPSPKGLLEHQGSGPAQPAHKRKVGKATLKLDEMSRSAKYIEQAFNAANEMLLVAHRVHRLKMLRFMPVRWLTRMVRAVAFIVKCYLTITAHKKSSKASVNGGTNNSIDDFDSTILSLSLITIDEIIQSIQRAAITLRDCSPDELHLCTRYSNVLMYLCSEMKTTARAFSEDEETENARYRARMEATANGSSYTGNDPPPMDNNVYSSETFFNPEVAPDLNRSEGNLYSGVQGGDGNDASDDPSRSPLQVLVGDNEVMEWFMNNRNVGLDFVGPWTEMIEHQLNLNDQFKFNDGLSLD